MRLKKTFVLLLFFFFAYIDAWLKSAKFKLDLVTSQGCMEHREGHFFQITAVVVLLVSFNWEELGDQTIKVKTKCKVQRYRGKTR